MFSYGSVFRVAATVKSKWVSRPYGTHGSAKRRAANLNNYEKVLTEWDEKHVPEVFVVEVLEGNWEKADG